MAINLVGLILWLLICTFYTGALNFYIGALNLVSPLQENPL